jgi:hypothetical protein
MNTDFHGLCQKIKEKSVRIRKIRVPIKLLSVIPNSGYYDFNLFPTGFLYQRDVSTSRLTRRYIPCLTERPVVFQPF